MTRMRQLRETSLNYPMVAAQVKLHRAHKAIQTGETVSIEKNARMRLTASPQQRL